MSGGVDCAGVLVKALGGTVIVGDGAGGQGEGYGGGIEGLPVFCRGFGGVKGDG